MDEKVKRLIKAKKIQVELGNVYLRTDANGKEQYAIGFRLIPKRK